MKKIDRNSQAYIDGKRNFLEGRNGPNMHDPETVDFEAFEAGWLEASSKSKIKLVTSN